MGFVPREIPPQQRSTAVVSRRSHLSGDNLETKVIDCGKGERRKVIDGDRQ